MKTAIFVTTNNSLQSGGGGVQLCTADYQSSLRQAGFELHNITFDADRRSITRLLRWIEGRPYLRQTPPGLADEIVTAVQRTAAGFVFLNLLDYPAVLASLRVRLGDTVKFVHLSHGLDSTDICIDQQVQRGWAGTSGFDATMAQQLGSKLICEADYRRQLDAALCLSPLDAELERWLGAPRTAWFPRVIRVACLDCQPVEGRIGCVATLNHPPNLHGFTALFEALQRLKPTGLHFRLVGSPEGCGQELAAQFKFVEYVGCLSDTELRAEAATWCAFVHPIFHYARGCSTKLAVALGWGLPVATTVAGVRGYEWDEGILPVATTPESLARMIMQQKDVAGFGARRVKALALAAAQPSAAEVVGRMGRFLESIGNDRGLVLME